MAWHASTHERYGVACTDCHNPHPHANVQQVVNINHYGVEQPKRLAMSVQEPEACYKCHQKIFAQNHLPSHHPIMEGKMVCSDCHDPHGQLEKNLKAETINQLCYKCHAEKTGTVRLSAPAGERELRDLPRAARHGGQQPAEAAADVPLPAMPRGPPRSGPRQQPHIRRRTADPRTIPDAA